MHRNTLQREHALVKKNAVAQSITPRKVHDAVSDSIASRTTGGLLRIPLETAGGRPRLQRIRTQQVDDDVGAVGGIPRVFGRMRRKGCRRPGRAGRSQQGVLIGKIGIERGGIMQGKFVLGAAIALLVAVVCRTTAP